MPRAHDTARAQPIAVVAVHVALAVAIVRATRIMLRGRCAAIRKCERVPTPTTEGTPFQDSKHSPCTRRRPHTVRATQQTQQPWVPSSLLPLCRPSGWSQLKDTGCCKADWVSSARRGGEARDPTSFPKVGRRVQFLQEQFGFL